MDLTVPSSCTPLPSSSLWLFGSPTHSRWWCRLRRSPSGRSPGPRGSRSRCSWSAAWRPTGAPRPTAAPGSSRPAGSALSQTPGWRHAYAQQTNAHTDTNTHMYMYTNKEENMYTQRKAKRSRFMFGTWLENYSSTWSVDFDLCTVQYCVKVFSTLDFLIYIFQAVLCSLCHCCNPVYKHWSTKI